MTEIRICERDEVEEAALYAFYRAAQPERAASLERNWRWLYRAGEPGPFPLLALHGERIVGHAGAIRVDLRRGDTVRTAFWFVDFWILPGFQRRGIGSRLTDAWMGASDLHVTFCNDRSIGVFRRKGWRERRDAASLILPLDPAHHPAIRRRAGLRLPARWLGGTGRWVARMGRRGPSLASEPLAAASLEGALEAPAGKALHAVRSQAFASWRLRANPLSGSHFLVREEEGGVAAVVRVLEKDGYRRLHVLTLSGARDGASLKSFAGSLVRWSLERDIHHLWCVSSDRDAVSALRRWFPVVRRPIFAFHASDDEGWDFLQGPGRWEAIDSDLDLSYP